MVRPATSSNSSERAAQYVHAQLSSDQPAQWYTHCDWRGSGALEPVSMDVRGRRAPSVPMITVFSDVYSALVHALSFDACKRGVRTPAQRSPWLFAHCV